MQEQIIGGAKIPNDKALCEPPVCSDSEREPGEREAERQELSKRRFFSGDPATALLSLVERVRVLEDRLGIDPDADSGEHPADKVLDELEAVKAKIDERPPAHEEPPAAIADMFQTDRPYAEQAAVLWKKYNELTNKIMMKLATEAEIKKHQKLQGELDWIKRHAFEGV